LVEKDVSFSVALSPAVVVRRLIWFLREEALSSVFAIGVFLVLGLSKLIHLPGIPRYDLLFFLCLGLQWLMVRVRLETMDELKAICLFHAIGIGMEMFKVQMGSWAYPEAAYLKVAGVPLYSGFMYASVGSYVCQAWRRLDLQIHRWPGTPLAVGMAGLVYANFFTLHVLPDLRWFLVVASLLVFRRTWVEYRLDDIRTRMPLGLSFLLIGFCVWLAENVATRLGAWRYPYQRDGWQWVHGEKIGSWGLLMIVTVVVVAQLKLTKAELMGSSPRPSRTGS
jgi:uncharacterized membrane protein YoaT (DUF817 family)